MHRLLHPLRVVHDWSSWWRRGFQPPYPVPVKRRTIARYLTPHSTFVETGTYLGSTARWASRKVDSVHTIELSETLHARIGPGLKRLGIHAHRGDSLELLPRILDEIETDSLIVWLDAHWSAGITSRAEYGNTPIRSEIEAVEQWLHRHPEAAVALLVDDLREFERDDEYPAIEILIEFARRNGMHIRIANDIFAAARGGERKH